MEQCVAAGITLSEDQCYGYKIPPVVVGKCGGKYAAENVAPTNLSVHYSLLADTYRQTKDLPDGTRVKAVAIDRP